MVSNLLIYTIHPSNHYIHNFLYQLNYFLLKSILFSSAHQIYLLDCKEMSVNPIWKQLLHSKDNYQK